MASSTALDLVNQIIVMTGDYSKLSTVVNSPSNIAERIINFLNMAVRDIAKSADLPELRYDFVGTADGTNFIWDVTGADVRPDSAVVVTVNQYTMEEVSPGKLQMLRKEGSYNGGRSRFFARSASSSGLLSVELYPTPANGDTIEIVSYKRPTLFTVSDTSTTEIMNDDLLILGALAHMDAFDGLNRGYIQRYEVERNRARTQRWKNQQIRIQPEDYR